MTTVRTLTLTCPLMRIPAWRNPKGQVDGDKHAMGNAAEKNLGHRAAAKHLQEEGETDETAHPRGVTLRPGAPSARLCLFGLTLKLMQLFLWVFRG